MRFFNTQTLTSILVLSKLAWIAHAAPASSELNAVFVRALDHPSPVQVSPSSPVDLAQSISERDTAVGFSHNPPALAKRYLISSPYQKRTIQLALKQAVHGLAAGYTWLWEISYAYVSSDDGTRGRLDGQLVRGDGSFAWGPFQIEHAFINKIDAIVTATFDAVVASTNEKMQLVLTWAEEFAADTATLEDHGSQSSATYFSANGSPERLSQAFFEYSLRES